MNKNKIHGLDENEPYDKGEPLDVDFYDPDNNALILAKGTYVDDVGFSDIELIVDLAEEGDETAIYVEKWFDEQIENLRG